MSPRDRRETRTRALAPAPTRRDTRSPAQILRDRTPGSIVPATPVGPPPTARAWGLRLLGGAVLVGTVSLVSCQALVSALVPGVYG